MVLGVYPGSFDPVTVGHVDVVQRASPLFEKVIVAVYGGSSKDLLFDADERVDLFQRAVESLPNVEVTKFEGLVVRFAKEVGAKVIIRGLRSGSNHLLDARCLGSSGCISCRNHRSDHGDRIPRRDVCSGLRCDRPVRSTEAG